MFDELNEATSIFKCAEDNSMMPTNKWLLPLNADGVHVLIGFLFAGHVKDGGQMIKGAVPYLDGLIQLHLSLRPITLF